MPTTTTPDTLSQIAQDLDKCPISGTPMSDEEYSKWWATIKKSEE